MSVHPLLRAIVEAAGAGQGRPVGSPAERHAQHICIQQLEARGLTVVERSFEFSAWPGRFATPVAGLLLFIGALITWLGTRTGGVDLPLTIGSAFLTIAAVGGAAAAEYGPTTFKRDRRTAVNLEATRGTPHVWLIAHLDSKSQTIPMLLRIAAIIICSLAWMIILTIWMTTFLIRIPGPVFAPFALVATVAAIPLILTFVGNTNTGALDNASGVATILEAVARLDPTLPIGVLITSAEELGLAGARAWVTDKPRGIAVNVDGIDDRGGWRWMLSHDDDHATLRTAITTAASDVGDTDARRRRVPIRRVLPGILVDAVAFKDAGWPAVTLSRGDLGSLARVHTSRDTLAHLSGDSIDVAADLVRRIVGAIIARPTE